MSIGKVVNADPDSGIPVPVRLMRPEAIKSAPERQAVRMRRSSGRGAGSAPRPGPCRAARRGRRRRRCQAAGRSYPIDQLDRQQRRARGRRRSLPRKIGRKTATAREDVSELGHISIMRPGASRACVQSSEPRGDFIKIYLTLPPRCQAATKGDSGCGKTEPERPGIGTVPSIAMVPRFPGRNRSWAGGESGRGSAISSYAEDCDPSVDRDRGLADWGAAPPPQA
jgi:hypothetical protein